MLNQINARREKGYSQLTKGVGKLFAKIVNEVPKAQLNFVPSEYNSADNLTRVKTVEQIFSKDATWFQPSVYFNQPDIPKFVRVQVKKCIDTNKEMEQKKALLGKAKRDIALIAPEKLQEIEAYRCNHINAKKRKIFCSVCPSTAETEIENSFTGMEKTEKSVNDNKMFLETLDE